MTTATSDRYAERGVSSSKSDVHRAIAKLDKGLYPGAFCKILQDIARDPGFCSVLHADGAGTKAALAYLAWVASEASDRNDVWRGVVRDGIFMNVDDIGCAGGLGPFYVSSSVDRNKVRIPGEVLNVIIEEHQIVCDMLSNLGIPCEFCGGETADVGDLVRTITINNTVMARFPRSQVINASRICAPALIVGFSSTGQAKWEDKPNSGIGSNGLTNARHDVLHPLHRKYTETYSPETPEELIYCGKHLLGDRLPGDPRFTICSALLSPTRTYLPLIKQLIDRIGSHLLLGLIHCSGGGQTKIGKFGQPDIQFVKDALFPIPPLFRMLQEVRNLPPRQMYSSYNMGHRLEAVVESHTVADECIKIAGECGIEAKVVGEVVSFKGRIEERVALITEHGTFHYGPN